MTDETKPASEADVVEAMCSAVFFKPIVAAGRLTMIDALTAARALGVLMPDEAALRDEKVRRAFSLLADTNAECAEAEAERDALAARLKVAEEALRGLVAVMPVFADDRDGPQHDAAWDAARAALTPPPEAKDAEA